MQITQNSSSHPKMQHSRQSDNGVEPNVQPKSYTHSSNDPNCELCPGKLKTSNEKGNSTLFFCGDNSKLAHSDNRQTVNCNDKYLRSSEQQQQMGSVSTEISLQNVPQAISECSCNREHPTIFKCDARDRVLLGISGHSICFGEISNTEFIQLCVEYRCPITLNTEDIGNYTFRPNDFEIKAIHDLPDLLYFQAKLDEDELYIIGLLDGCPLILARGGYYYNDIDDQVFYLGYDWTDVTLFCTDYDKALQSNAKLIVSFADLNKKNGPDDWIAERNEKKNKKVNVEIQQNQQKGSLRQGRAKRNENGGRKKVY
eukprot:TRINITY_DN3879_c0_g2_i5.p1 TRINITY_DN3879_c0_g2~~TRINITY_DN3879_c0_g2_i5.p1  ORF type:complete len:313 (-),score=45.77 TRINITY_DN3879_c0_g2_i5:184-1122(-)